GISCPAVDTILVTSTSTNLRDECVNATLLQMGNNGVFNNKCATTSGQSTICFVNGSKDVWFKFQGTKSGKLDITVKFISSITGNFNLKVGAFKGNCNALMALDCVNENPAEMDEVLHLSGLNPNDIYYLSVDGFGIQEGSFRIQLLDPCVDTYTDYLPLETFTGLCQNQVVSLSAGLDSSKSLVTNTVLPAEHYGIFFDIVAKKGVKIKRIASAFKMLAGNTVATVYFKKGSSVGFENNVSGWTGNGFGIINANTNEPKEIPVNIEEILMPGDTLGVYLYTNTPNAGIRMNGIGIFSHEVINQNDDIALLKGRFTNGPQFSGLNSMLAKWLNGSVKYERIDQIQWLRNGTNVSNNFNYTFSPSNSDQIILRMEDHAGCRIADTTIINAEGKIVTKEMGIGLGSLSSVLHCALVGDTIRFHSNLNGKTIKLPQALDINVDNALIGKVIIEGNGHHFLTNTSPFDVDITFKNIQFIKGNGTNPGVETHLFRNVINSTLVLENCIIENSGTTDNIIQNNGKVVLKNVLMRDNFATQHLYNQGQIELDGQVQLKK
ncbi:MAG TPA: hypothetical protein PLZ32_16330, partial [Saprospiraceae bacterium]|nr:hypothetical protein [Saprospiraceae bacterium]